jgi:hypothetical protein
LREIQETDCGDLADLTPLVAELCSSQSQFRPDRHGTSFGTRLLLTLRC